jgi:autotransporter-associated beta strand protein
MKRVLGFILCAGACLAAEKVYVGGEGGNWSDAASWSPSGVPGEGDVAVFNNAVAVEIARGDSVRVGGLAFNAAATIVSGAPFSGAQRQEAAAPRIIFPDGTSTVFVANGVTAVVGADVIALHNDKTTLVKTGKGTCHFKGYPGSGGRFDVMDIMEGEVLTDFGNNNDGLQALLIRIRDGALLRPAGYNQYYNYVRISIDEGGVYDAQSQSDALGGIVGTGLATNMANQSFTLGGNSDYVFSGVCHSGGGAINIGHNNLTSTVTQRFVIASADCATAARFSVYQGWWDRLTFAPGVGTFRVKRIYGSSESGLILQDSEGGPVRVDTEPSSADRLQGTISGPGTLGVAQILYVTNGAPEFALTGGLGAVSGNTMIFGDNVEGETFSYGGVSWLFADDSNLRWNLGEDFTADIPVAVTNGQIQQWGKGALTLSSVSISNVLVRTEQPAGPLTILSGDGKNVNFQNNSTNGTLTVSGCTLDGVEVYSGTWNAAPVVFRDSEAKNMKLSFNSGTTFHHKFVFDGGRYEVTNNNFGVYSSNSVVVSGGELTFLLGQSTQYNRFMMPWTFTGGRSIFYHPTGWNQGFGADISGEGTYVRLMNTNLYETTIRVYRVASDGYSHVVRVRDGGHFVSDGLNMNSPGTSVVSTGAVEVLEGGTWTLCTGLQGLGTTNERQWSYLFFDGGVLETGGGFKTATSGILLATAAHHFTWVGEKGVTLRHSPGNLSGQYALSVDAAFNPAPWVESDGGLVRVGQGALAFYGPLNLHGPYDHRDGAMRHYSGSAAAPMGFGNVILRGAVDYFLDNAAYSAATDPGATVTICSGPQLLLSRNSSGGSSLVLGPSDAAQNSVLVKGRAGSALMILDEWGSDNTTPFGDGPCSVKVNGGVESSATTGLPILPVIGMYRTTRTGDRNAATPLAYDVDKGFVMPAFADDDFTGGASSHVRVLTATTLSQNASVGSLSVFGCATDPLALASGVTLTVGDGVNPAILILNSSSSHAKVASISGGTVDFGGSEGVISGSFTKGNTDPAVISSVIDGRNGLSISGFHTYSTLFALSGANTYSGDTYVNNAVVHVKNAKAFSSGTVHALGAESWGGALLFDTAITFSNPLHVSGYGAYCLLGNVVPTQRGDGALRFTANTTISGPVALDEGTTRFTSSVVATFTGAMSGPGAECLELAGVGTFVFNGASTCTNSVTVCEGTTLRLGTVGSAGSGPMRVDGRVVFANAAAGDFNGAVTGGGEIVLAGAAVRFADLSRFTGAITAADGATIDLLGADVSLGALNGAGTVTNSGAAATLSLTPAESIEVDFSGAIGGDVSLVKSGAGTQHLSGTNSYTGATIVDDGALVLRGRDVADTLPVADAVLRLDASSLSGFSDGDTVAEWSDADGRGWTFANSPAEVCPKYAADALNGHPALWFGDLTQTRLICASTFKTRTIFTAYRTASGTHPGNWGCAGFFGYAGQDRGLRFNSSIQWNTGGWNGKSINFAINGVDGVNKFTNNVAVVASAEYDSAHDSGTYAVGDYWADTRYNRFFYGWIGELIVYDRVLTDDEKAQVNAYLMKKWGIREYAAAPALTNALPETTALTVTGAGVLDLAGGSHAVASIAGDGLVTNSAAESAELRLTGAAAGAFTGRILGDVTLMLVGDASIDLGGGAVNVTAVGGEGRVANGTLAAGEIRPGGMGAAGTLVFERAPAPGATYVFDGFGDAADRIVVEGDFDLSSMAFRAAPFSLSGLGYEILTVDGTRSGQEFSSVSGTFRAWGLFHLDDGSTWLKNKVGTILIFK